MSEVPLGRTRMTRRELLASMAALGVPGVAQSRTTHHYAEPRRGIRPRVEVLAPDNPTGAVVLLHGGAFVVGNRSMPVMLRMADALNQRGLVALSVDYRMLGRGGRFDASLADVLAAMDWWREQDSTLPLGVLGMSAGGALAAIAASEGNADACVGVYGPYDFTQLPGQPRVKRPTKWLLRTTDPKALHAMSPLNRASSKIPTLLFHGRRDRLVPIDHAHALVAARQSRGLPVELVQVDAGHGYLRKSQSVAARQTVDRAAAFLARSMG